MHLYITFIKYENVHIHSPHYVFITRGEFFVPRHLCAESFTLFVFMFGTSDVADVKLFHSLAVLAVYVRCLECEGGTSTTSSLVSVDPVYLWAALGESLSRLRCGTSCTWALWKTTRADTSCRCSSDVTCAAAGAPRTPLIAGHVAARHPISARGWRYLTSMSRHHIPYIAVSVPCTG